jgi:acyl carrier protein
MDELIELLEGVRDDVDFRSCTDLIDGKVLTSFDIIQIIASIDDEFDVAIPAAEIVPANFNSAESLYALIKRLQG